MNTDQMDLLKSVGNVGRKRASEMTEQEIKRNKPDGATGYILNNDDIIYVKDEMIWFRDTWWFASFTNKDDIKPL